MLYFSQYLQYRNLFAVFTAYQTLPAKSVGDGADTSVCRSHYYYVSGKTDWQSLFTPDSSVDTIHLQDMSTPGWRIQLYQCKWKRTCPSSLKMYSLGHLVDYFLLQYKLLFFFKSLLLSAVISRWKDIRNSLRKHFISNASIFLSPLRSAESTLHCRIAWWEWPGTCVSMNFVSKLLLLLFHMLFSLAIVVTSVIL